MLFEINERDVSKAITKDEFNIIKTNKEFFITTITKFIQEGAAATRIYDFLNQYMPGFYERFYFHICYINTIDTRVDSYNQDIYNESLKYCKQYYNKIERPDLLQQQLDHKGIMMLTRSNTMVFNTYMNDEVLILFFNFVDLFATFKEYYSSCTAFLRQVTFTYRAYKDALLSIDESWKLFGKPEIKY